MGVEDVAVVGAGAVGLTTALALAERGVDVTVFDRDEPGSGATGRAAGLCYDAYVERTDANLAARSLAQFREWGVLTERPYVWVAREGDDHVAAAVREQARRMRERGREVTLFTPDELAARFPALRTDHLAVGAAAANAGYVDADAFVEALVERTESEGVTVRTDSPVAVTPDGRVAGTDGTGDPDAVLIAAGAHTRDLAAEAGCDLALGTYRAQALATTAVQTAPPILYDASERFYLRPDGHGLLVGNGAHAYDGDPDGYDRTGDEAFVEESLASVETALGVSPEADRTWAGLCTATPDRDPLVGECEPGLFVAAGWHGHGFMRAPAIGETLAEQILGGEGIDHFDPTRFDGDESVEFPDGIVD